jgi:hypothetical protein
MNASRSQVKWIHVLKSKLGLSDDNYRAMLDGYGVKSSLDLPMRRAYDLIQRMENQAVLAGTWTPSLKDRGRYSKLQGRDGMASPAQLRKIEAMWSFVSRQPTPEEKTKALHVWLEKRFHIGRLEWVKADQVGKVIGALEAMVKQKEEKDGTAHNRDTGDERCGSAVQAGAQPGGDSQRNQGERNTGDCPG